MLEILVAGAFLGSTATLLVGNTLRPNYNPEVIVCAVRIGAAAATGGSMAM